MPFPNQASAPPVSNGAPSAQPPGPEQGMDGGGRLAQLTPEELNLLKNDPVVVELIKKIAPEVAQELDALAGQAQPDPNNGTGPAPMSPGAARMAAPTTQLGRM